MNPDFDSFTEIINVWALDHNLDQGPQNLQNWSWTDAAALEDDDGDGGDEGDGSFCGSGCFWFH